jgi:hypothetical protein
MLYKVHIKSAAGKDIYRTIEAFSRYDVKQRAARFAEAEHGDVVAVQRLSGKQQTK